MIIAGLIRWIINNPKAIFEPIPKLEELSEYEKMRERENKL